MTGIIQHMFFSTFRVKLLPYLSRSQARIHSKHVQLHGRQGLYFISSAKTIFYKSGFAFQAQYYSSSPLIGCGDKTVISHWAQHAFLACLERGKNSIIYGHNHRIGFRVTYWQIEIERIIIIFKVF